MLRLAEQLERARDQSVRATRVEVRDGDLLAWALALNHTLTRAALRAARGGGHDVVHAHDWLVAHAAVTVRDHLDVPLVATVHATESGRHQGWLPHPHNRTIDDIERWLVLQAARTVVCSGYMRREVRSLFGPDDRRVDVVRNGVDALRWQARPRPKVWRRSSCWRPISSSSSLPAELRNRRARMRTATRFAP